MFGLIPGYDPIQTAAPGEWFDATEAERRIQFIQNFCSHIEGKLAGKPFRLEPWQRAVVGCLFGWKRRDGSRRYRELLLYVPRKNGKTPLAAAIVLCCLMLDREIGAQNLCAAGDKDQATLLFRHCQGMVNQNADLTSRLRVFPGLGQRAIFYEAENSGLKVVPADAAGQHGFNGCVAAIDELHVQPNRDLLDVIQTSMASANRIQPLLIEITTADYDRPSICNEKHDYACRVRDGVIDDSAFLPVIYETGKDDDWTDERVWERANPNLDVSVSREYLRRECKRAQEVPAYQNTFRRLHLNQRTGQVERIIDMGRWDACRADLLPGQFAGRECYVGFDIGATSDFCAMAAIFPRDDGERVKVVLEEDAASGKLPQTLEYTRRSYDWLCRFWLPERPVKRDGRMMAQIDAWATQGYIVRTPGDVVDYDEMLGDALQFLGQFRVTDIAVDRGWQGMSFAQNLQRHYGESKVCFFPQGILSMAPPCREMMELLAMGRLHHDGHPVLRWMASNVAAEQRGGLMKFSKDKSTEKIDGLTAGVMALGRAMTIGNVPRTSIYSRGVGV